MFRGGVAADMVQFTAQFTGCAADRLQLKFVSWMTSFTRAATHRAETRFLILSTFGSEGGPSGPGDGAGAPDSDDYGEARVC